MKRIPLTQNKYAIVDDADYEYLNQWKWRAARSFGTDTFYAVRKMNGKTISMHRVIANTPAGLHTDHINGDGLDNRRCNLRHVTNSQNQMNRPAAKNNKLGIKNIFARQGGYQVNLHKEGRSVFRKWFKNLSDAIDARNKAVSKHHAGFSDRGGVQ